MSNKITAEHKAALAKAIGFASKALQAADRAAADNSDPVAKRLFAQEANTLRGAIYRADNGDLRGQQDGIDRVYSAAAETQRVLAMWGRG